MFYIKEQHHQFGSMGKGEKGVVSAIIPVYGKKLDTLQKAIQSVLAQSHRPLEIVVVSNGVDQETLRPYLGDLPPDGHLVFLPRNMGAAYARNAGALRSRGETLWFVDSDVYDIRPECVQTALERLGRDDRIGSLGGIIFADHDRSYFVVGRIREEYRSDYAGQGRMIDDDFVNTACIFIKRRVFDRIEGFADVIEYPFDDVDFGYKIQAGGYRCVGAFPCAGTHPLHPMQTSLFHEFMTMHNLLLHLFMNYNISSLWTLLRKKQKAGWRMAPPRRDPQSRVPMKFLIYKLAGLVGGAFWLLAHPGRLFQLRIGRQQLLRRLLLSTEAHNAVL